MVSLAPPDCVLATPFSESLAARQPVARSASLAPEELRHEIGNALTAAASYAHLLMRWLPPEADPRVQEALEAIRANVDRAVALLDRQLAAAPSAECDLCAALTIALAQVAADRVADLTVHGPTVAPLLVSADEARLVQVLANLLDNAAKYSPPGTPIEVELGRTEREARVAVRDRGIGVPSSALEAIFDGHRTPAARATASGRGIGLRLSRRWLAEAGGRLWATSAPGEGSTFVLALPLLRATPD